MKNAVLLKRLNVLEARAGGLMMDAQKLSRDAAAILNLARELRSELGPEPGEQMSLETEEIRRES